MNKAFSQKSGTASLLMLQYMRKNGIGYGKKNQERMSI